jgi:GNAT superfamily N-acetyltransferase
VDVLIRPAAPGDARAIAEAHVASWRWAYRGQMPDDLLDDLSVDEREARWREILAGDTATAFVAVRDGSVVGFASGGASTDDDAPATTGEVYSIYVIATEAGKGTGAALFTAIRVALAAKGFVDARLWVLETNGRARRFYEREGWGWDGSRSDHQEQCANLPIVRYAGGLA